MIVHQ